MSQEIEDDRMTRNRLNEEEDENESNPYQMVISNKKSRDDTKIEQMINWSIFSDLIKYVDGSPCSDVIPSLTIKPLDDRKHKRLYNSLKIDEDFTADIIFEEVKQTENMKSSTVNNHIQVQTSRPKRNPRPLIKLDL